MKCQTLFSGKNKKNIINLPSTENVHRVVKVNVITGKRDLERLQKGVRFCFVVVGTF